MDHQLSDELNLDNAMGVDFEHGEDSVVNQADISLQSSDVEGMAMEFEHIEEQAMLMESAGEEIVGTESLIGEEFTLDEGESYVVQDGKVLETNVNYQSNVVRSETMMDLQYEPQTLITTTSTTNTRTQIIPIKAAHRPLAAAPKQIAIAPKPAPVRVSCAPPATRHVAIAPKLGPKTAAATGPRPMKTMSLSDVLQSQKAGQTVITQLGKQFVMMPAGASGQKIKLVQAGGQQIQAQFVTAKNMATGQVTKKPVMAKVIVTSQGSSQQSAEQPIITGVGMSAAPRFVQVQPRTVAISLDSFANKIMGSPTKHGIRFSKPKQHIVTVQSTSPTKLLPAPTKGVRLPVTADGSKNVVLKAAFPHKVVQAGKADGPRTQIHQINVPGKGVQYIRLVTNPTTSAKAPERTQAGAGAATTKNIVFTDSKGNVIQMAAEKVLSGGQPPPLVVPGGASLSKVTAKPQQKLVRIAPVVTKVSQANTMQFPRSGQSLLAPVSALPAQAVPPAQPAPPPAQPAPPSAQPAPPSPEDSKAALRALIEDAVREDPEAEDTVVETQEMWREDDHDRPQSPHKKVEEDNDDSMDRHETNMDDSTIEEHPLIVIPSNFEQREESNSNDRMEEAFRMSFMNINPDTSAYQQPQSPANEEDLEDRPRKACNCTKSQCLKLYCDCFANGEFCNRCNCTNCHNNLENEELRQKAIRGCLDRNPNAFRPKIGKSRAGGPETIRRHNKGCNCKRSGCLKNYCECYEAKIACTGMCKCVGCRNVEMALERLRRREAPREPAAGNNTLFRPPPPALETKQPCSFMTTEVIEAVCQCLLASGAESEAEAAPDPSNGQGIVHVLEEFARCLQDIIGASQQEPTVRLLDGSM